MSFPADNIVVVDSRLAAGRGAEFSASAKRLQEEDALEELDYHLPIGHRADNAIDSSSLQQASLDTAISENNVGFKLLQKMGWKGKGLGRNEDGIVEPVKLGVEAGVRLGVGKQEEDNFFTNADNVTRKRLEAEIQATEDATRKEKREALAEREQRIKEDVSQIKRTFYCEVCSKQYNTAMELETHLSSYDHHHRKRLMEMKAMTAERTRGNRQKKEEKRMAKEMVRLNEQLKRAQQAQHQLTGAPPLPTDPAPPLPAGNPAPSPPPPPAAALPDSSIPSDHTHHRAANAAHHPAHKAHVSSHSAPHQSASTYQAAHQQSTQQTTYHQTAHQQTTYHQTTYHQTAYQQTAHQQTAHQPPASAAAYSAGAAQRAGVHSDSTRGPGDLYHKSIAQVPASQPFAAGVPQPPPPAAGVAVAPSRSASQQGMTIKLAGMGMKPRSGGLAGAKRAGVTTATGVGKHQKMQASALFGVESDEES